MPATGLTCFTIKHLKNSVESKDSDLHTLIQKIKKELLSISANTYF